MNKLDNSVLNETNEVTNQDIGRMRVIETESGIEFKYHITERERLFSQYSLYAVKTAKSTVEMCRVVFEAKEELSKEEFSEFCTDIGHKGEDSTIRKYLAIGAAYERLIQYADKLPNSWTSIYTITQIPSETFNALAEVGESFAKLSGNQIKALVDINNKKAPSTDTTSTDETTIEVTSTDVSASSSTDNTQKSLESNSETSSEVSDVVIASTDETSTEDDSSSLSSSDDSDDESVSEDAVVKANALLERVTTTATTSVNVDIEDEFEPYKLLLCFNSKPSDEAKLFLVDCIFTLKSKYRVDIELKSQELELY